MLLKRITTAYHWQLFALMVIVLVVPLVLITLFTTGPIDLKIQLLHMAELLILLLIVAWVWSIGNAVAEHVSPRVARHIALFRWSIRIFVMMQVVLNAGLLLDLLGHTNEYRLNDSDAMPIIIPLVVISSLFYLWATWYCARLLNEAEARRYGGVASGILIDFVLIWVFPIGVWFLQPRVNLIVNSAADQGVGS